MAPLTSLGCGPLPAPVDGGPGLDATVADAEATATDAAATGALTLEVAFDGGATVATLDHRYLSFTVDTHRLITVMPWESAKLQRMTQELAPAVMRVGGTLADKVYYDLSDDPVTEPPDPDLYEGVMTKAQFDAACDFALAVGVDIAFTLNAGDGPRDGRGRWTPDAARELVEYAVSRGCPVTVWELGNEVSSYFGAGLTSVSPGQYSDDTVTAHDMLDAVYLEPPGALLAGPASFYMPGVGEATLEAGGFLPAMIAEARADLDIVTWHYYPTRSRREACGAPIVTAEWDTLLEPSRLDDVLAWADEVERARNDSVPDAQVWLDETGHAVCGGEENLSDAFVAGLWWVDMLGQLARRDQEVVARQSLTGGDYHLIENDTLVPYPDYFNSILFRRLMGAGVLDRPTATVVDDPPGTADPALVRLHAQCTPGRPGAVTVLAVNLSQDTETTLLFPAAGETRELYLLTAEEPTSKELRLNDVPLAVDQETGAPPSMEPAIATEVVLPPISYAFVVLPDAAAAACE